MIKIRPIVIWTNKYQPYTIRLRYTEGVTPTFSKGNATQLSSSPNVWELRYENSDWSSICNQHQELLEILGGNLTGVTNLYSAFSECRKLTKVNYIDIHTVTNLKWTFEVCLTLSDVAFLDTSSVTSMYGTFASCWELQTVPLFDTSNVTTMHGMFDACSKLTSVPLFDTSNVTDMAFMFDRCSVLQSIPLFDTSKVTDFELTFANTDIRSWPNIDFSHGQNFRATFQECYNLPNIGVTSLPAATNVISMFYECYNVGSGQYALYQSLSQIPNIQYSVHTFQYCGRDTPYGPLELAQIPSSWGGTGA